VHTDEKISSELIECDLVFKDDDGFTYLESTVNNKNKIGTDLHTPNL